VIERTQVMVLRNFILMMAILDGSKFECFVEGNVLGLDVLVDVDVDVGLYSGWRYKVVRFIDSIEVIPAGK